MEHNELYHHGIKGMKWGIRRNRRKDGDLTPAGKKRYSSSDELHEDYKKVHSRKSVKTMSDAELRNRLNRLQMERQYNTLSMADVNKGKRFIERTIKNAGMFATVTSNAITIYNNVDKIQKIIKG